MKALFSIKEIFASLVNTFVFDGTPKVKPEQIVFLTMQGKIHRNGMFRYFDRDTLALVVDEERRPWFLIGFENQTGIDPDMDIRNLTYDATTWHWMMMKIRQTRKKIRCAKKSGREIHLEPDDLSYRIPCVTIVLHYGKKEWKPRTLAQSMPQNDCENLKRLSADYKINVENIAFLTAEVLGYLHGDFRAIARYLQAQRLGTEADFFVGDPDMKIMYWETLEVLKAFSADRIVESVLDSLIQSEKTEPTKGGVVMAGAFEQYMNTVLEEKMEKEKKAWLLEKQRWDKEKRNRDEEIGEAVSTFVILAQRLMLEEGLSAQEACDRLLLKGKLREKIMKFLFH